MNTDLTRKPTPEERELEKKKAELALLESKLADVTDAMRSRASHADLDVLGGAKWEGCIAEVGACDVLQQFARVRSHHRKARFG